jgi:integrase
MGRRDYAILMMLAKLGLRADEVATLTLDDIDWRASEMLVAPRADNEHGCPYRRTLARPLLHICAMAAQGRRAGGCSSARSRRMLALLPDVRSQ